MSTSTTRMHNALWNAFVVKAVDLLPSNLILKKRWTIMTAVCDPKPEQFQKFRNINTIYSRHAFMPTNYLCQTPSPRGPW